MCVPRNVLYTELTSIIFRNKNYIVDIDKNEVEQFTSNFNLLYKVFILIQNHNEFFDSVIFHKNLNITLKN